MTVDTIVDLIKDLKDEKVKDFDSHFKLYGNRKIIALINKAFNDITYTTQEQLNLALKNKDLGIITSDNVEDFKNGGVFIQGSGWVRFIESETEEFKIERV